jgi:hypothetical protein
MYRARDRCLRSADRSGQRLGRQGGGTRAQQRRRSQRCGEGMRVAAEGEGPPGASEGLGLVGGGEGPGNGARTEAQVSARVLARQRCRAMGQ